MLGGFAYLSPIDIRDSLQFLMAIKQLQNDQIFHVTFRRALDCGAGIGRVTKNLLLPLFEDSVDLLEQSEKLLRAAPDYIGDTGLGCSSLHSKKTINLILSPLQVNRIRSTVTVS